MGNNVKKHHSFTVKKLVVESIPHLAIVFIYLTIAESSRLLSGNLPLVFFGFGILAIYWVGWRATFKKRSEKSLKYSYGQDDFVLEFSCIIALFMMFALFFQDLHHQFPWLFIVDSRTTYLNWLLFTVENVFESVVDVLSIYDINVSGIQSTDTLAKTAILIFRFTVNIVLIVLIARNWRNLRAYFQLNKKRRT